MKPLKQICLLSCFFILAVSFIFLTGCTSNDGNNEIEEKCKQFMGVIKNGTDCNARETTIIQVSNYFINNQIKSEEFKQEYQAELISISNNDSCENVRYAALNALVMFRKYGDYASRSNIKITADGTPRVGHTIRIKVEFSSAQDTDETSGDAMFSTFWSNGISIVREGLSLPDGFTASPEQSCPDGVSCPYEGISWRGNLKANEKKEIEFELKIEKTGTFGIRGKLFASYSKHDYEQIDDQLYLIVTESGGEVTRTVPLQMEV